MSTVRETVVGICREVFDELGSGHSETVYHHAILVDLRLQGISYESEKILPISYKGSFVGFSRSDIIINNELVVELKAVVKPPSEPEITQTKNYMKILGIPLGLVAFCIKNS